MKDDHIVVFVTARDPQEARKIGTALLEQKLAACVNIVPGVESLFWWQGKLDRADESMLVINPSECIDCGVCEPECPAEAILPDTESGLEKWLELNAKYSAEWPNITSQKEPPADADDWKGVTGKRKYLEE